MTSRDQGESNHERPNEGEELSRVKWNPETAPDGWEQSEWDKAVNGVDVPESASLTTKMVDSQLFFYYEWEDGGSRRSEYVGPVHPE